MKLQQFVVAAALLCSAALAQALDVKPYSATALADAQKADKPVALHFHADWCPTCKAQASLLQTLKAEPGLELTVLVANYDDEKDLKRRFNVRGQSTLVVLRGDKEVTRSVGDTTVAGLRNALKAGLKPL
jgi:thioredoxin 1